MLSSLVIASLSYTIHTTCPDVVRAMRELEDVKARGGDMQRYVDQNQDMTLFQAHNWLLAGTTPDEAERTCEEPE